MAAFSSFVAAAAAATGIYSGVKSAEAGEKSLAMQKEQAEDLKRQQEEQKEALAAESAIALGKRKEGINKQRKQLVGVPGAYSINKTKATGASSGGSTLTGGVLG